TELALAIVKNNPENTARIPETILDHGALVPLYFIAKAGIHKPILPIAIAFLSLKQLFFYGKMIAQAAEKLNRRVVIIASADMSHRLTKEA
ncbi:AmmeMemoRadiSam system protein B, partial [candidate division WOR-1 bacterium RIFOXYA2_FULL_37_7]